MPFVSKKELKQELNDLHEQVNELKKIVITDELNFLREQKKLFDEQTELLSNVHFKVKDAKVVENEASGTTQIKIVYQLPVITIDFDENGTPKKDNFFYSVNSLGLIDLKDTEKLVKFIDKVKNEIQNKKNA